MPCSVAYYSIDCSSAMRHEKPRRCAAAAPPLCLRQGQRGDKARRTVRSSSSGQSSLRFPRCRTLPSVWAWGSRAHAWTWPRAGEKVRKHQMRATGAQRGDSTRRRHAPHRLQHSPARAPRPAPAAVRRVACGSTPGVNIVPSNAADSTWERNTRCAAVPIETTNLEPARCAAPHTWLGVSQPCFD